MDDSRATPSHDGGLGRRILLSEVQSQLSAFSAGTSPKEARITAELNTAELNAVLSGSKPAFLETIPGYVRALARNLPPGCAYAQASNGANCIYNAAAIAEEFNLPPGTNVHAFVVQKLKKQHFGRLLGYGMETITEHPRFRVRICRDGIIFSGFFTSPHLATAQKYAEARLNDFRREYPQDDRQYTLTYQP